jgi:hypothetical protein
MKRALRSLLWIGAGLGYFLLVRRPTVWWAWPLDAVAFMLGFAFVWMGVDMLRAKSVASDAR